MAKPARRTARRTASVVKQGWQKWGQRLSDHNEAHGVTLAHMVDGMKAAGKIKGDSGSGIRHWLNGTRDINLNTFFVLCEVCQAEPDMILFGGSCLPAETSGPLREAYEALVRLAKGNKR